MMFVYMRTSLDKPDALAAFKYASIIIFGRTRSLTEVNG